MKAQAVLALDLATVTGWALVWAPASGVPRVSWGTWDLSAPDRVKKEMVVPGYAFATLERHLGVLWERTGPWQSVYWEKPIAPARIAHGGHVFGAFMGTLVTFCWRHHVFQEPIYTTTVKKHWTGSGRAGKTDMIDQAKARGFGVKNDNEADALALLDVILCRDFQTNISAFEKDTKGRNV